MINEAGLIFGDGLADELAEGVVGAPCPQLDDGGNMPELGLSINRVYPSISHIDFAAQQHDKKIFFLWTDAHPQKNVHSIARQFSTKSGVCF